MKRLLALFLCFTLLTGLSTASAAPLLTSGGFTAYLGDGNHLYLENPQGEVRVLQYPVADILSLTATDVYALTQDGRLFSLRLDGSKTTIIAEKPTEADIAAVTAALLFELADGVLSLVKSDGSKVQVASRVQAAAANGTHLYFIEADNSGATTLKSVPLTNVDALTAAPKATPLGMGVANPVSMTATEDAVSIVCWDHSLAVIDLKNNKRLRLPALSQETVLAVSIGELIYCYKQYANGAWLLENQGTEVPASVEDLASATAGPTATPKPTPTPRPTPDPTPAPTPTARVSSTKKDTSNDPSRLRYGDSGEAVRRMQRRLSNLGYPVGKVDGIWGQNTQLAVNLFQFAIGYKERSYASGSMQNRLYSSDAPKYNRYRSLRPGDEGTPVRLMQRALYRLGFLSHSSDVDGIYGSTTKGAVLAFQQAYGSPLSPTGYADSETLVKLFSGNIPSKPQVTDPNYPELITPPPATETDPNYPELITPPPSTDDPNSPELITPPPSTDVPETGDPDKDDSGDGSQSGDSGSVDPLPPSGSGDEGGDGSQSGDSGTVDPLPPSGSGDEGGDGSQSGDSGTVDPLPPSGSDGEGGDGSQSGDSGTVDPLPPSGSDGEDKDDESGSTEPPVDPNYPELILPGQR